jgi:hypothetical protein
MNGLKIIIITILVGLLLINTMAQNSVPQLINFQGYLTDENGKALSDTYDLIFRLYPDTLLTTNWDWSEEQSVVVENGLYNVLLGSINPIKADTLKGEKYLGITVKGQTEMKPRLRIASVAYSLRSEQANKATESNYAHILSAPDNDPLEAVVVTNDGKVGIGTANPQAILDVAGGIFVNGGAPFEFRRYSYQSITQLNNVIAVNYNTGMNTTDWAAAIVGYDAGWGDLNEGDNQRLWKIQMVVIGVTWHISLAAPTHGGKNPDWTVDVMFVKRDLVNSNY